MLQDKQVLSPSPTKPDFRAEFEASPTNQVQLEITPQKRGHSRSFKKPESHQIESKSRKNSY